jgi:hypothetical protein
MPRLSNPIFVRHDGWDHFKVDPTCRMPSESVGSLTTFSVNCGG